MPIACAITRSCVEMVRVKTGGMPQICGWGKLMGAAAVDGPGWELRAVRETGLCGSGLGGNGGSALANLPKPKTNIKTSERMSFLA